MNLHLEQQMYNKKETKIDKDQKVRKKTDSRKRPLIQSFCYFIWWDAC
jgi:hypothetical protein